MTALRQAALRFLRANQPRPTRPLAKSGRAAGIGVVAAAMKVKLSRTWTWEPKTGQVTYESKDKDGKPVKVTYNRSQMNNAPTNVKDDIDPAFNNDNYWFIFPFHVYWDTSAKVEVKEKQKLPIGAGTATLVSVKYPSELGGYTPGDTWNLYVGTQGRIVQFV